ncbi:winged helix-turn-helix transcriptional regulator [Streptomyces triticiradicis]|uniref:Winged helix-turn-helix transcriptional regulator n=1 Tax=Streptomyces triticiradicis TaxID=2651189 RepID=A0A7J5D610_9ACTN|nr:winged helix-turn-helix transcriptional regulator [Streptomyces triticiradicis]KAB1979974.1 winged helix-turn-helix transcriptional regulator [Streptomyces triticiradicis]
MLIASHVHRYGSPLAVRHPGPNADERCDARQTNREPARKLGIAPSTCLEQVRALRDHGLSAAVDQLRSFLLARFGRRREIVTFRSSVIYQHLGNPVTSPLGPAGTP